MTASLLATLSSLVSLALFLFPAGAQAASFDGATLGLVWAVPFAGMLLSIALMPLFAPRLWHHHYGKIALGWAFAFLIPFALQFGVSAAGTQMAHALLLEYIPFLILLVTLYTVAGGICFTGNLHGAPLLNTGLLAIGTVLASVMGTTGAAMLMVRPVLRANDNRVHNVHTMVFFIFLIANAGGALTPLGDPPLFLGFLKGVTFGWTFSAMLGPTALLCGLLLGIYYLLDRHYYIKAGEERPPQLDPTPDSAPGLIGKANFALLAAAVGAVLLSGSWQPGVVYEVLGQPLALQGLVRDGLLIGITVVSLAITPAAAHEGNGFNWGPMQEVAKLFLGIFLTIIPVIAMLRAGESGAMAAVVRAVTHPDGTANNVMYFWMTGLLSGFLDNAPTYLVFFNLAGGDAQALMAHAETLEAISAGAVFMGALSYIGNAPNFMVKAIAESRGIAMPGFFGYMAWSVAILVPLFVVLTLVFFV